METVKCRAEDQGKSLPSLPIDTDRIFGGYKVVNKEIGEKLFISSGTVKRRTENIYSKLGVLDLN